RHRRDSSALVLRVEYTDPIAGVPEVRDLVVQYARADRVLRSWCYPEDPCLPALAQIGTGRSFLQEMRWGKPWVHSFSLDGDCSVQRLLYNPGHRATFLLSSPRSAQKLILKIVRPDAFVACLDKIEAIECSVLHARIALPRLSSYALQEHVLLYEYLPGQG